MKHSLLDHIPIYGVTKEQHDKWAEEHDRAFTDADTVIQHRTGGGTGKVAPKQSGLNQIDPVASRLRGAGSAQR